MILVFRDCVFQEKVEILFNSFEDYMSLVSNSIENIHLLVRNGNAEIEKNIIDISKSSLTFLSAKSMNLTENIFKESLIHPKFKLDESYIRIEKKVNMQLQDYTNFDSNVSQKIIIKNNIYQNYYGNWFVEKLNIK